MGRGTARKGADIKKIDRIGDLHPFRFLIVNILTRRIEDVSSIRYSLDDTISTSNEA